MRIRFFTDYYLPIHTGVSISIAGFREQLEALGHKDFVFAPSSSLSVREEDDHTVRFPAIKGLFVENYMTSMFFPPQQIRKVEKLDLDLIHFHTPSQIGLLGIHIAFKAWYEEASSNSGFVRTIKKLSSDKAFYSRSQDKAKHIAQAYDTKTVMKNIEKIYLSFLDKNR